MEAALRFHPLPHLMRTVWLQVLRRKDVYLLALVMILFAGGALVARLLGIDSPQMAQFLGSLGFSLSSSLAAILAIIVAARQLPSEIDSRTIYPVLAKPVSRDDIVWGKFLPTVMLAATLLLLCAIVTLVMTPHLPLQRPVVLIQAVFLKLLSISTLTMLTFMFSLLIPSSMTVVVGLFIYFLGGVVLNVAHRAAAGRFLFETLLRILPDFTLLDTFERYVNGGPALSFTEFSMAILYGALWFVILAAFTLHLFRRRAL